jgi:hypothetical protein
MALLIKAEELKGLISVKEAISANQTPAASGLEAT